MAKILAFGVLGVATILSVQVNAAILYPTPPASTGLTGYTSTITINADGSTTIVGGGPNFGGEDSLVHVVNNSAQAIGSLALSGIDIFGFDADGTLGGFTDPLDYSGALVTFTTSASTTATGSVNFTGGLAANADSFFELEEDVGAAGSGFSVGPIIPVNPVTPVPEPATLALLGAALFALIAVRDRMRA